MIRSQYNDIAQLYDLLAEGDDGLIWFRHYLESTLNDIPKGSKVLDCSCGTGNHAIWLAKQGFEVHASDISERMLEEAQVKAANYKLKIHFFQSSWKELAERTDGRYELVVCPGNSLSHIENLNVLDDTFIAFRKILNPGGVFFFDIRNWEKTYAEKTLEDQHFRIQSKDSTFDVWYRYDMPEWNRTGQMHVDISPAREENYKRFSFNFLPMAFEQIHDAAIKAGFTKIERGYFPGEDYYFSICKIENR